MNKNFAQKVAQSIMKKKHKKAVKTAISKPVYHTIAPQTPIRHFLLYKPYGMLSQFTREVAGQRTLADLDFDFPTDVYPVGRLDHDSEGLLILSNDKTLPDKLLNPANMHERAYWVQVEGSISAEAIMQLQNGVLINVHGKKHQTMPALVKQLTEPVLPARNPPIRFRANVPTSWISIVLHEGKNRQIRRMTAAVGFPTLRLVRARILNYHIEGMNEGEICEISQL
jgi:23S rRNA pseudouridine2457 synthase